jgi:hypothetical protein
MKRVNLLFLAMTLLAACITGVASADDTSIYGGFANGNPDLYPSGGDNTVSATAPGVGDSYNHYQGDWAKGNEDLFMSIPEQADHSRYPEIYHGFGNGDVDL